MGLQVTLSEECNCTTNQRCFHSKLSKNLKCGKCVKQVIHVSRLQMCVCVYVQRMFVGTFAGCVYSCAGRSRSVWTQHYNYWKFNFSLMKVTAKIFWWRLYALVSDKQLLSVVLDFRDWHNKWIHQIVTVVFYCSSRHFIIVIKDTMVDNIWQLSFPTVLLSHRLIKYSCEH